MPLADNEVYEFGTFRLDAARRVLTRAGTPVSIQPKTFDLLLVLVQRPGYAFSKKDLMAALWRDTFVEEANLSFQVSVLRRLLGTEGGQFLETVPKHGYRFVAGVRTAPASENSASQPPSAGLPSSSHPVRVKPAHVMPLGAALLIGAVAVYFAVSGNARRTMPQLSSPGPMPLTSYPGFEQTPTLSPDGSQVAFSWNGPEQRNFDIYVKLVGPGEPRPLTTHAALDDSPAWSPDGGRIAFLRFTSQTSADLMVIPALGGAEEKIATTYPVYMSDRPFRKLSWTADGKWLVFGGRTEAQGAQGIWLISADGREKRKLTDGPDLDDMGDISPVPSPDGTRIAFIRERTLNRSSLFILPFKNGAYGGESALQLTSDRWGLTGVAWTPDGRDLVFSWSGHFGLSRLSRISAKPNQARDRFDALPFGEQATALSISQSGRVVYSTQFRDTAFFEASLVGGSYQPLAGAGFSSTFDEDTPHCSPDGRRVAFSSTRSGVQEIWVANRDGSHPSQVTSMGGSVSANARWSPRDGRTIVFDSRREGSGDLYTLVPDTRELQQLTTDTSDEIEPRWSRDGRWIYFGSNRSGRYEVWRIAADGGDPKQITRRGGTTASESPDGKYLFYAKTFFSPTAIWRVPVEGGAEEPVVEGLSYSLNFVVAEHGLYFVAGKPDVERASIDYFEFATGRRTTIVDVQKRWWHGLALCADDTSLIFPLVNSAGSNLMLVESFR